MVPFHQILLWTPRFWQISSARPGTGFRAVSMCDRLEIAKGAKLGEGRAVSNIWKAIVQQKDRLNKLFMKFSQRVEKWVPGVGEVGRGW